jgi:hypothetical protein
MPAPAANLHFEFLRFAGYIIDKAQRHQYSTFDVGRSMFNVHFLSKPSTVPWRINNLALMASFPTLKIRRQDGFELVCISDVKMIGAADNLKLRFVIPSVIEFFDQI